MASLAMGRLSGAFVFLGIGFAAAIATVLFLLGTLASAQGQILRAALDTAVNSSRFLTDQDCARIMSLPYGSPAAAAITGRAEWRCRCGQNNPGAATACLECGTSG